MFFNIHGKSSKYLKYKVKTYLVQGFRFYVTFFGDGKRACRFLNNANLQIRRFVKKPTISSIFNLDEGKSWLLDRRFIDNNISISRHSDSVMY